MRVSEFRKRSTQLFSLRKNVGTTTMMPVGQISMEAPESRFAISDSDLSINPFVQSRELTKLFYILFYMFHIVKHGNKCAHIERGVRYLHRKSYIHLSLKEASTQLASHADVLRGA